MPSLPNITPPEPPDFDVFKPILKIFAELTQRDNLTKIISKSYESQLQQIASSVQNSIVSNLDFSKIKNITTQFRRAGLTPNLNDGSIANYKDYERLLKMGYSVFWVPREEIVKELLSASSVNDRKSVVLNHEKEIIEDCEKVLNTIDKKYLEDYVLHMKAALKSQASGNFRAAQSSATGCFDALLDKLIDEQALMRFAEVLPTVLNSGKSLHRKFKKLPVQYAYAALQISIIRTTLRKFDRLRPHTILRRYGRHSSAHSVDHRQFTTHNSLQALMICTTLLATTNRLGSNWITNLLNIV